MTYRHLTKEEINKLLSQNCYSDNWTSIVVKEGYSPENIFDTRFEGNIKLGICSGTIEMGRNVSKKSTLADASHPSKQLTR